MRLHLGLTWLAVWLMALGLAACAAQTPLSAEQLVAPGAPSTLLATVVRATPTTVTLTRTPTRSPSPTLTPTQTATAQPTKTEAPVQFEPTAVLTPNPAVPPASDGVARIAEVPILMYHYISTAPSAGDRIRYSLSVSPEIFDAQLKLLHDNGFATISLRELYEYLVVGAPLPDKSIVLTFDDGYIDNYANAFPILQKYGMTGTFFVLTGRADDGDPAYLSWDMIQEMSNAGMDIQLHSRDHLDMRNRPYDWLVFQIIGGRQSIEGHTGKPVIFMAYPSGRYDANVLHFLRDANFWAAVTTASGRRHALQGALNWDRVRISGQLRLQDFARLLGINIAPQRAVTQPTATLSRAPQPTDQNGDLVPSTRIPPKVAPTMTPTGAPIPAATPPRDGTPSDGEPLPFPTFIISPLMTPTFGPSPLLTPVP